MYESRVTARSLAIVDQLFQRPSCEPLRLCFSYSSFCNFTDNITSPSIINYGADIPTVCEVTGVA